MIIFCDIDHTLADSFWRDPMWGKDWDAYYKAGDDDKPIVPMVRMMQLMHADGATIVASTARPEKWRQLTMQWLVRYEVPMDQMFMRADNDRRPSPLVKLDFMKIVKPDLVIDDRTDVCAAFCEAGISTLLSTFCGIKQ